MSTDQHPVRLTMRTRHCRRPGCDVRWFGEPACWFCGEDTDPSYPWAEDR